MSNGTATLTFLDPQTFKPTRYVVVHDQQQEINRLNELEYINGKIYANIWLTKMIAIISPENGNVEAWINIKDLNAGPQCSSGECTANGIAYNPQNQTLLVTGKDWNYIYEIKLIVPNTTSK